MGDALGFVVEFVVALLLAVTIGYCLVVNRKLERLRSDQSELKEIIRELNLATAHAERAISGLQKSADTAEDMLGAHVESARDLSTRLAQEIAQGEEIFSKLSLINKVQARGPAEKSPAPRRRANHGLKASHFGLGMLNATEGRTAATARPQSEQDAA